jgi:cation diffusion facilitator family transporter
MQTATINIRLQKAITVLAIVLFVIKVVAYLLTNSVSIFTDALESTVNIAAGFLGIYSLRLSAKPKDTDHPYGHGKIEFLSAAVEGTLIIVSAILIVYTAIKNIAIKQEVQQLNWGIILIAATAIINYSAGVVCTRVGKKNNSLPLIASGAHLKSDTYTTVGIIAGLLVLYITKISWIDSAVAICFALFIAYTGYRILRSSIAGIMDEADEDLLKNVIDTINNNKSINWVDMHNLRIIKYGAVLHLDAHVTLPWYFNVAEAHVEVDKLTGLLKQNFGDSLEIFVHTDACETFSCKICAKQNCTVRINDFVKEIIWNKENISANQKHYIN